MMIYSWKLEYSSSAIMAGYQNYCFAKETIHVCIKSVVKTNRCLILNTAFCSISKCKIQNRIKMFLKGFHEWSSNLRISPLSSSDEPELEFSGSSRAIKVPNRAELGHFNFRAENELTIPTIKKSQILFNSFFPQSFYYQKSYIMISINFMIIYLNFYSKKSVFIGE